jgi:hypothetical protein
VIQFSVVGGPQKVKKLFCLCAGVLAAAGAQAGGVTLGTFTFNDQQFGDTLTQSDGGTFLASNWLNVVNANPGSPGALTGANFNTGIANIGNTGGPVDYAIGYNTPIVNGAGNDFGLVVGYSWPSDTYHIAVSTDGGSTFSAFQDFSGSSLGVDTGVNMSYYYGGGGPYATDLVVVPIDLNVFGIALGSSVNAIEIQGNAGEQPDLFRIAGFGTGSAVPEPMTMFLTGAGLVGLAVWRRRR